MADRRNVALTVVGVLALLALVVWIPYATRQREVVLATPGPHPIHMTTAVALPAGGKTCVDNVTLEPQLASVRTKVIKGAHGGPVDVLIYDAGHRQIGRGTIPAGFSAPAALQTSVSQSLGRSTVGTVCLVNHGPPLTMEGTDEAVTRTRSNTTVDGTQVVGDMTLELLAPQSSVLSRAGDILTRASAFKPLTRWEVEALAILLLLLVPAGLGLALVRALRE
jgi:hypothetical protein